MLPQNEFEKPIEIFFNAWQPDWDFQKITLLRFQEAEEIIFKDTTYWAFIGTVETRDNPLKVNNGSKCRFWFSRQMFRNEIKRHLCLHTYPWDRMFDVTLEVRRPSKFELVFQNVETVLSENDN